ncbi:cysteine desulfurase [Azospirillum agricola]|uniref:cysteine desulfurase family protein n=1 Tax=Azospirillum agricola TaxID=1720247 RepID=UPI001AE92DBA|nr:aminotransferase class V-fold PLP-dependent enzyme [Azospirillum agricola]MBP2226787.1 cysteine desulfurase [Azospirillum agricola]
MTIYLDNNATTALAPEVREAMLPHLFGPAANPSSPHGPGMAARLAVGEARAQIAALIGAKPADLVMTGSAAEATHAAILGALRTLEETDHTRSHIVTTAVEHPSTLALFEDLRQQGWRVTILPVNADGLPSLSDLGAVVTERTALVSMMWANNETGVLMPVAGASAIAHAHGALFHTDAAQAAGRVPVDCGIADYLTLSAHKMHGPKGVGALYVRKGAPFRPLVHGHQERRRRGGTENVPGIVGFGAAASLAALWMDEGELVAFLRDRLEAGILARWPGAQVNGGRVARLPNTTNIRFADGRGRPVDAEELLTRLDRAGIAVSMGAACSSGGNEPSHVLTAMGLSGAEASASLRFSLSRYSTAAEIDAVLGELPALHARLVAA